MLLPDGRGRRRVRREDRRRTERRNWNGRRSTLTLRELFKPAPREDHARLEDGRPATTEQIHGRHLVRILGNKSLSLLVQPGVIQGYVDRRVGEKHREQPIKPTTVSKEVKTLGAIWRWAWQPGHYRRLPMPGRPLSPKAAVPERCRAAPVPDVRRDQTTDRTRPLTGARHRTRLWAPLPRHRSKSTRALGLLREEGRAMGLPRRALRRPHRSAAERDGSSRGVGLRLRAGIVKIRERKRKPAGT